MRMLVVCIIAMTLGSTVMAQEKKAAPAPRFGVPAEVDLYPQGSPKQLLVSITKAMQRERMDYFLAHLLDPVFADTTVAKFYKVRFEKSPEEERGRTDFDKRLKQAFDDFMKETNQHMVDEAKETAYFTKLLKEGTVEEAGTSAKVTHKDVPGLALSLRQSEGRWHMLNDKEPETSKK